MTRAMLFPCAMMILSLGAAFVYVAEGDTRKALYWLFAAAITATVTF